MPGQQKFIQLPVGPVSGGQWKGATISQRCPWGHMVGFV